MKSSEEKKREYWLCRTTTERGFLFRVGVIELVLFTRWRGKKTKGKKPAECYDLLWLCATKRVLYLVLRINRLLISTLDLAIEFLMNRAPSVAFHARTDYSRKTVGIFDQKTWRYNKRGICGEHYSRSPVFFLLFFLHEVPKMSVAAGELAKNKKKKEFIKGDLDLDTCLGHLSTYIF